ncbi:MAG: TonB-dependent receptor [Bacteroidales bacterium]|nr:TonB-dependent receptor [Bacteroidales bacterium]
MFVKRFIIIFIAFAFPFFVKGQLSESIKKGLYLETDFGYGFIMPHHKSIEYFVEDHIRTFDLKVTKATYGNKYWNQLFRYPYYGIGFYRSNLGNNDVYGYVNALYSYIKVPIIGASNRANLSWQFAFGASYITNYFDIEDNPQNLAIASHLNMFIDFSLQSTIPLSKQLSLTNGVRFTHVSNGKVKSPNKGLNVISGSVGLLYQLNDKPERIQLELPQIENKNEYTIVYAVGVKTKSRYEPDYYFASSLILDYNRNYSLKGKWELGTDIFFDGTNRQYSQNTDKADIINSDLYQLGLHAGHEWVIGHLALVINIGGYIYAPVEVLAPIYSRIGLRYRINDKFITNFTLKSHWAKASFLEWGIGYVFN